MQSLSKYNKGTKYLLCSIDLFIKYARGIPLKDKRGITIANAFQKIISKRQKPNKIWVDQGGELKCVQHKTKENLVVLKDLLGLYKTNFLSTW